MFATAKNYDVICLQMRNYQSHLEPLMKKEVNRLLTEVRTLLASKKSTKANLDILLPRIFNFRIKAIKWLIEEDGFALSSMMNEVYPQLEELRGDIKLQVLVENILFALRCNRRVVEALIQTGELSDENFADSVSELPAITYDQFLASLAYSLPDDESCQKIVNWVHSSLYIEFITLTLAVISEEKLSVSDQIINELAFLVADAAQEYSATATELGILKTPDHRQTAFTESIDKKLIKEQAFLSDLGIDDFAQNFKG
jgi:hypothetical protein